MKTEIEKEILAENNISAKKEKPIVSIFVFVAAAISFALAFFLDENNESQMPLYLIGAILLAAGIVKLFISSSELVYTPTGEKLSKRELYFEQREKNEVLSQLEKGDLKALAKAGKNNDNLPIRLSIMATESNSIALYRLYQFIPYTFEPISELKIIKKE
ncbi:MAG: hypothetical protein IJ513_08115 [Bacteroidaceae bacterium]|nr:hypothetical protein [Bacteroidaceae bacterium]